MLFDLVSTLPCLFVLHRSPGKRSGSARVPCALRLARTPHGCSLGWATGTRPHCPSLTAWLPFQQHLYQGITADWWVSLQRGLLTLMITQFWEWSSRKSGQPHEEFTHHSPWAGATVLRRRPSQCCQSGLCLNMCSRAGIYSNWEVVRRRAIYILCREIRVGGEGENLEFCRQTHAYCNTRLSIQQKNTQVTG